MRQLAIDHRILHDERVVFTPHIAFYTEEAVQKILNTTIGNIKSFMKGRAINLVN
jgi:lactate dehydrogenase-like 2-hydroxyacid dehydrogenase